MTLTEKQFQMYYLDRADDSLVFSLHCCGTKYLCINAVDLHDTDQINTDRTETFDRHHVAQGRIHSMVLKKTNCTGNVYESIFLHTYGSAIALKFISLITSLSYYFHIYTAIHSVMLCVWCVCW